MTRFRFLLDQMLDVDIATEALKTDWLSSSTMPSDGLIPLTTMDDPLATDRRQELCVKRF